MSLSLFVMGMVSIMRAAIIGACAKSRAALAVVIRGGA
jgi:hypothetical protein